MKRLVPDRRETRTLEQTAEAGRQVEALIEHPGWEFLLEEADAKADGAINLVGHPKDKTATEYADAIAYARALRDLPRVAEAVIKRGRVAMDKAHELEAAGQAAE